MVLKIVTILTIMFSSASLFDIKKPPACEIFCKGPILRVVQNSNLFADDKTFLDMKMKVPAKKVLQTFKNLMEVSDGKPTKVMVRRFVRRCFAPVGSDFDRFIPTDWVEEPRILKFITDRHLQKWAKDLISLWQRMGRKIKTEVRDNPDLYSIVYLPHPVIVPGGRYREYYYWDSYWTILGLLRSEMYRTVKGMLENFILLVKNYGYVPNGGRIYYLMRSNLPLLIPMFKRYHEITNDTEFIKKNIGVLETEFEFWMTNRSVVVPFGDKRIKLNRYVVESDTPRPEAYRADVSAAKSFSTAEEKSKFYSQVKTACESGWSFSSRWFIKKGSNKGRLKDTKTKEIIPVDLNAVICMNAKILSQFFNLFNMTEKSTKYEEIFSQWKTSIRELLWDVEDGIWYDYDMLSSSRRKYYYASNLTPLWTECFDNIQSEEIGYRVTQYLKSNGVLEYDGGIPTSLVDSGSIWDFPNAFPPMQHIIITGLKNCGNLEAKELAFKLAHAWIRANFRGYIFTNIMYPGYNAKIAGQPGHENQIKPDKSGYGWTNGVSLDLLYQYGRGLHTRGLNAASFPRLSSTTALSTICLVSNLLYS